MQFYMHCFNAMAFWGVKLTPKMNMDRYVRFVKFVSTLWQNRITKAGNFCLIDFNWVKCA